MMTLPSYPIPEPADIPDDVVTISGVADHSPADFDEMRADYARTLAEIGRRPVTVTAVDSVYTGASGPVVAIHAFPEADESLLFLDLTASHGAVIRVSWTDTNASDVWDTATSTAEGIDPR
jgi:hypothetical protein